MIKNNTKKNISNKDYKDFKEVLDSVLDIKTKYPLLKPYLRSR